MFKSKYRPVVVPQFEHTRLSGWLAYHWGNEQFDRPPFDFNSFVKGVTEHDRGYGFFDNAPIGEFPEAAWLTIIQRGVFQPCDDRIANVVSLMHMRRLLSYASSPKRDALCEKTNDLIDSIIAHLSLTRDDFEWADTITRLCDNMAFDFSFGEARQDMPQVCQQVGSMERVTIRYQLGKDGVFQVDPWPFSVERYSGFVMGYELEGYPDRLEPVLLPFSIVKAL